MSLPIEIVLPWSFGEAVRELAPLIFASAILLASASLFPWVSRI